MPIYEYVCKKCGHKFEKIQKFSDPKIRKCPECGGTVEQALHAPAVQFKGTGWYVTDYAKKAESSKDTGGSKKEESHTTKEKAEEKTKKPPAKKSSE